MTKTSRSMDASSVQPISSESCNGAHGRGVHATTVIDATILIATVRLLSEATGRSSQASRRKVGCVQQGGTHHVRPAKVPKMVCSALLHTPCPDSDGFLSIATNLLDVRAGVALH